MPFFFIVFCPSNDSTLFVYLDIHFFRTNDLTGAIFDTGKNTALDLFNRLEGEDENVQKFIEFIEPCPKVQWAGELNRDRSFTINTESDNQDHLVVTVFNPNSAKGSFSSMISGRLEKVNLNYRRKGDLPWNLAMNGTRKELDFACQDCEDVEDSYGYVSMNWLIAGIVSEGIYEIKVGTQCDFLGGLDDIDMFDAPILTGVIDLTRPEQYGKPLPFHDQVIIGEEMSVIFTEAIDCGIPYSFDIKVIIEDTPYSFGIEELQVICQGHKIGFQIDPTVGIKNIEAVMGKVVKVEIGNIPTATNGNVFDVNGNSLDPLRGNIKFEKTLANLNLDEASTSFTVTLGNVNCTEVSGQILTNELKEKIAVILETDATQIEVTGIKCLDGNKIAATVKISPSSTSSSSSGVESSSRRLRRESSSKNDNSKEYGNGKNPTQLFYKLQDISAEMLQHPTSRQLSETKKFDRGIDDWLFGLSNFKILPCASDVEKFSTLDTDLVEEERRITAMTDLTIEDDFDLEENKVGGNKRVGQLRGDVHQMRVEDESSEKGMKYLLRIEQEQMEKLKEVHSKEMQEMKRMYQADEKKHQMEMQEMKWMYQADEKKHQMEMQEMTKMVHQADEEKKEARNFYAATGTFALACIGIVAAALIYIKK